MLEGLSFPLMLLDEASQCSEPEVLIPLTKVRGGACTARGGALWRAVGGGCPEGGRLGMLA